MTLNPIGVIIVWVGAYFVAHALKLYVKPFMKWNFFLLMLTVIIASSFLLVFIVAFIAR